MTDRRRGRPHSARKRSSDSPDRSRRRPELGPDLPLRHPALIFAAAIAASCVVISVSFQLYDTDLWQLLVTGKAMWSLREIPRVDLWTWPGWGIPQVMSSWLFRVLLWPIWSGGGVWGLYLWRWLTTLAAFAFLWATARRMGARGLIALVSLTAWALLYRSRAHVRPETLAAVLFAIELFLLERRRRGGPDRSPWLVALSCVWANTHVTYWIGLAFQMLYALDSSLAARVRLFRGGREPGPATAGPTARGPTVRKAWIVLAASSLACLLNPFGWRALWQPFEFALFWRNDPMFRLIGELTPLPADFLLRNLHLFLPWPLLALWRGARRGFDFVEIAGFLLLFGIACTSVRFLGLYALFAAPFFSRDLQELVHAVRWPGWTRPAWARAGLAAAACVALCLPEWLRNEPPLGIGFERATVPAAACDFLATHGIGGRGFNHFHLGGYQAYRFWPDRAHLPFITTQPENVRPDDRRLYASARFDSLAWQELDGRYRFDYALLDRNQITFDRFADFLDRDSSWALVFGDDAGVLYARTGASAPAVQALAFRVLPGGREARERLLNACFTDSVLRARARADLERQVASSPENARAKALLGILSLADERLSEGEELLEDALRQDPRIENARWFLGLAAARANRPGDAIRHLEAARRAGESHPGLDFRLGQAYQAVGDHRRARQAYRRALERDPGHQAARDSLARIEGAASF